MELWESRLRDFELAADSPGGAFLDFPMPTPDMTRQNPCCGRPSEFAERVDPFTSHPQSFNVNSVAKRARQLAAIRRAHGIIAPKPGEKPFAEWWAEHKREERELEERKFRFCTQRRQ
jgi:hypothetical protein